MSVQSKVLELFEQAERRRESRLSALDAKRRKCDEELAKKDKAIVAEYELALSKTEGEYERGKARIEKLKKDAGLEGLGAGLGGREKDAARRAIAIEQARVEEEYKEARAKAVSDRDKAKSDLQTWTQKFAKAFESEKSKIEQDFKEELEQINMRTQGAQTKTGPPTVAPYR